jgi:adenylate cyclase
MLQRPIPVGLVALFLTFLGISGCPSVFRRFELQIQDLQVYTYGHAAPKPSGAVVIAAIDDYSVSNHELGKFPWQRSVEADLITALTDYYHAAAIGLDLLLTDSDPGDARLAAAMRRHGAVFVGLEFARSRDLRSEVLADYTSTIASPAPSTYSMVDMDKPMADSDDVYRPPVPIINSAARGSGFVNIDSDPDNIFRTVLLVKTFHGEHPVPLNLLLVSAYLNEPLELHLADYGVASVSVGNKIDIPVDETGHMMIHFRGPADTFPTYSIASIIKHQYPRAALDGKIVMVGSTETGNGDTPAVPVYSNLHGVEFHANVIDNILQGDFIRRSQMTGLEELVATIVLGLGAIAAASLLQGIWAIVSVLLLAAGYVGYAQYRLDEDQILLGMLVPLACVAVPYLVLVAYRYIGERAEKGRVRSAFEQLVDPSVVRTALDEPTGLKLGGQLRHATILFADIVNFTSRSERMAPEILGELINTFLGAMTDVIRNSGGVVDKFIGDEVMVYWLWRDDGANAARAAIDCGLGMLAALERLRRTDPRFADLYIGVGVHDGQAVAGNFGGAGRFNFSLIGDAVNFASRLQGLTRQFKVKMLVSRQAYDESHGDYVARQIGLVKVKGKTERLPIVEVAGHANDGVDPAFCRRFSQALARLRTGEAGTAREELRALLKERPDDYVTELCLAKLESPGAAEIRELVFEFETK